MTLATPMERGRVHPIPATNDIEFDYFLDYVENGVSLLERDIRVSVDLFGSYGFAELTEWTVTNIAVEGPGGRTQWLSPGDGRDFLIDYLNTRDQRFAALVHERAAEVYRAAAE